MYSVSKVVAFIAFVGVALLLGWVVLFQVTQAEVPDQTVTVPGTEVPINSFGYQGFQGGYQNHIENVAADIPEELQPALEDVTFVNGCHPWTTSEIGKCPLGTFDSAGWDADDSVGHEWSNTIWVSTRAVTSGTTSDVVLHETGHAFVHNLFGDCYFPLQAERSVKALLLALFAHDQASPAELLADAFVVAYGKGESTRHTYYLDKFNYSVSAEALAAVRAGVWLCSQ